MGDSSSLQIFLTVLHNEDEIDISFDAESLPGAQSVLALPIHIHPENLTASSIAAALRKRYLASEKIGAFKILFENWQDLYNELPANWTLASSDRDKAHLATLHALILFLDENCRQTSFRQELLSEYNKLLYALYKAEFIRENGRTTARFRVYEENALEVKLERVIELEAISFEQWWEVIQGICDEQPGPPLQSGLKETEKGKLGIVLRNSVRFALGLQSRPPGERLTFAGFLKAYSDFARRRPDAVASLQVSLPSIHSSIALLDDDPWEEKEYIKKIFGERSVERREELVQEVLHFAADISRNDGQKSKRLVVSVAEQYLNTYNIRQALVALGALPSPGLVLQILLHFYCHPWLPVIIIPTLLAMIVRGSQIWPHLTLPIVLCLSMVFIICVLILLWGANTLPIRLLFPRLFGAIAVGTAALLTNDLPNRWNWQNLGLATVPIAGLTYLGALVYLYLEVEAILKQSPETIQLKQRLQIDRTIGQTTLTIFAIGVAEALVMATITIVLFTPLFGSYDTFAWAGLSWPMIKLDPSLILLWAGAGLFLGSFVQLLWQDRRVTAVQ